MAILSLPMNLVGGPALYIIGGAGPFTPNQTTTDIKQATDYSNAMAEDMVRLGFICSHEGERLEVGRGVCNVCFDV